MIITKSAIEIESTGIKKEEFFGIEDYGLIFEILRHKMYSNSIAAICREISCNARDAHREVGKQDIPINISLPTRFDAHFRVRDQGPGITPDRMFTVFLKYASSTKRGDNLQTGGFGLGAKTPFAYSDTFNIVTTTDEVKRTYTAVIDETRIGKLMLISEISTPGEPNGTEIMIPVEQKDFESFKQCVFLSTKHWDIKPIITPSNSIAYPEIKSMLAGKNWRLIGSDQYYNRTQAVKAIVDGIEYPVERHAIEQGCSFGDLFASYGELEVIFPNGVLSLAANREQLDFDIKTKLEINKALKEIYRELSGTVQKKIDAASSYKEASKIYFDLCNTLGEKLKPGKKKFYWNSQELFAGNISVDVIASSIVSFTMSEETPLIKPSKKLSINKTTTVVADKKEWMFKTTVANSSRFYNNKYDEFTFYIKTLDNNTPIVINDTDSFRFTPKQGEKIVRALREKLNEPEGTASFLGINIIKLNDQEKSFKTYPVLGYIGYTFLSDLLIIKDTVAKTKAYKGRLNYFKFNQFNKKFGMITEKEYQNSDKSKTNIGLIIKKNSESGARDTYTVFNTSGKEISYQLLQTVQKNDNVEIYGFTGAPSMDAIKTRVKNFISLETYLQDKIKKANITDSEMTEYASTAEFPWNFIEYFQKLFDTLTLISDKTKPFTFFVNKQKRIIEIHKQHTILVNLARNILSIKSTTDCYKQPDYLSFTKRYPMLSRHIGELKTKDIADYINLVDKHTP